MTALLVIIYVAFISLGLPDSMLGSAWPAMHADFGVSISSAGIVSAIIACGTIVSSLLSDRLIRKFGTAAVTIACVCMTAVALLGISAAPSFLAVCLWAVPLGLGAGSIDAALNNFVALHYKASHMNWLHSFWGIGASLGPIILSALLVQTGTWRTGYFAVGAIQLALSVVLVLSLPLWKKVRDVGEGDVATGAGEPGSAGTVDGADGTSEAGEMGGPSKAGGGDGTGTGDIGRTHITIAQALRLPKARPTMVAFFCYCSLEATVGLWGSSFLMLAKGIDGDLAAGWIALFFVGITLGRMLAGFLALRVKQTSLLAAGLAFIGIGIGALFAPGQDLALVGLLLVGLGCAPIFPGMLHETPKTFGEANSQQIMGMQMACAYTGTTLMPPLFGLIAGAIGYGFFPVYLAILVLCMAAMVRTVFFGRKATNRAKD